MTDSTPVNVFWFRRDLRLYDNRGLYEALNGPLPVVMIFIFDKSILEKLPAKDDRRVAFIHHHVTRIRKKLESIGAGLLVFHDTPGESFENLCQQYNVKTVFTNHDYEPYAIKRDGQVASLLKERGIGFKTFKDQVIFEKMEVAKKDGKPFTIFTPYANVWRASFSADHSNPFDSEGLLRNSHKFKSPPMPSLQEIGFISPPMVYRDSITDDDMIRQYREVRDFPAIEGTSHMGKHLRFGTVSIRELVKKANAYSQTWLNELIWREFFMMILSQFPMVVNQNFKRKYDALQWRNNEEEFEKWCKGETGYAMVDAGMRQLNETGWMHNRVRMLVAGFLTKHLLIDWRWGEAYFAEKLIDYELSSNNGNWQWAAGTGCDAAPYFRIFNPETQQKKFDPDNLYVKKWIPGYAPRYLPKMVEHDLARKRALEVFGQLVN